MVVSQIVMLIIIYVITNANGVDKLLAWHVNVVGYLQDYH